MATKIIEKIIEPSKILAGSNLKLKIKAIRYATYRELKEKQYRNIKTYDYKTLKGE